MPFDPLYDRIGESASARQISWNLGSPPATASAIEDEDERECVCSTRIKLTKQIKKKEKKNQRVQKLTNDTWLSGTT